MLQIKNINKRYQTGNLIQQALDDVSLNLRDNEFVAVLGPSGSGKTTLLNIIGGLDRYDTGDIIINGISTKKYTDHDWDSYRNHTIGFVFQNYNLISHQSILSNVELALTISGVGKNERKKRAMEALREVGLEDQAHKKPGQMSGGQMQRVAIARALINDPDILLADEPTGALDTETSIQVMDLLKQVAKDRLVVMVTHNPDLAEKYANRIVRLQDGKIISDSNPYIVDDSTEIAPVHKNMGKSSMSFATALALSFNNLRTKKARTILTAVAGSIGIIGIALIMSLSSGANDYIQSVEEDTMSDYPLQISSSRFDLTSMMLGIVDDANSEEQGDVRVTSIVTNIFSTMNSNDLKALKEYLDEDQDDIRSYAKSIEYIYDVTPQIYRLTDTGIRQVNPDSSFSALGFGSSSSSSSLISSYMSTDVFYQMPSDPSLYIDQYDVMAGRWPENYNECVLVLSSNGSISDFLLYTMGLRDTLELDTMIQEFINEDEVEKINITSAYSYEDFLGISFKLVSSADYYEYDSEYNIWIDKTENDAYMRELVENGEDITIVGVVQPSALSVGTSLSSGINYPYSLTEHVVELALEKDIVTQQLASPDTDIFTGEKFGSQEETLFDIMSIFSIDMDSLVNAISVDYDDIDISYDLTNILESAGDFSYIIDSVNFDDIDFDFQKMDNLDLTELMENINISISIEELVPLITDVISDFQNYISENTTFDYTQLQSLMSEYLSSNTARDILEDGIINIISENGFSVSTEYIQNMLVSIMTGFQNYADTNGYTDPDNFSEYLIEYLNTSEAQEIIAEYGTVILGNGDGLIVTEDQLEALSNELSESFWNYIGENSLLGFSSIIGSFADYLETDEAVTRITEGIYGIIDINSLQYQISYALQNYMMQEIGRISEDLESQITSIMNSMTYQIADTVENTLLSVMEQMTEEMQSFFSVNMFNIDEEALSGAFGATMDQEELSELLSSLFSSENASYDSNLVKLGYADFSIPTEIDIYPKDFKCKEYITDILDTYNLRMEEEGEEDKIISYTDVVGSLMTSITDIINIVSYILIAFVAISLVVSSIMIGVITYISVLERKKEIGILRAIGASKNNISTVFNAETFIIGLTAGILGIAISLLLLIPGNAIIHSLAGTTAISAKLPASSSVILVILSIVLTIISGLIPSRQAAKNDPVLALRVE